MEKSDISKIAMAVRRDAERLKNEAGYSGSYGDGGAGVLEDRLIYWMAGIEGRIPSGFQPYLDKANLEADDEYKEYQRLQAKFAGK